MYLSANYVRLHLPGFLRPHQANIRDPAHLGPPAQISQGRELRFGRGHDQLTAPPVGYASLAAVAVERLSRANVKGGTKQKVEGKGVALAMMKAVVKKTTHAVHSACSANLHTVEASKACVYPWRDDKISMQEAAHVM